MHILEVFISKLQSENVVYMLYKKFNFPFFMNGLNEAYTNLFQKLSSFILYKVLFTSFSLVWIS